MRGATKAVAWLLADACLMLAMSAGCNAVFGLDDRSFGEGGAGSSTGDASSGDTSTSDASSSSTSSGESSSVVSSVSSSTGEGGSGGSGGAGLCETKDWIVGGDFAVDSETLWDEADNVTITAEVVEEDRVMRIDPVEGVSASTTHDLSGEESCVGGCIRVSFEVQALASFDFGVGVSDDDATEGGLRLIGDRNIAASTTFELIETEPCLIPEDFVSPDRVAFAFENGGDMYVDDVMLIVDDCPAEAVLCERF